MSSIPKPVHISTRVKPCERNQRRRGQDNNADDGPDRKLTRTCTPNYRENRRGERCNGKTDKAELKQAMLDPPAELLRVWMVIVGPVAKVQARPHYISKERHEQNQWRRGEKKRRQRERSSDAVLCHTLDFLTISLLGKNSYYVDIGRQTGNSGPVSYCLRGQGRLRGRGRQWCGGRSAAWVGMRSAAPLETERRHSCRPVPSRARRRQECRRSRP
jgi:hypothetical protein